jgi:hypothetical protein
MSTSLPLRARKLHLLPLLGALVFLSLMSNLGWADSCSAVSLSLGGRPIMCTLPEETPELSVMATLSGLSFAAQAEGMVLIYDDAAHTVLSDVVTFTNVGGVATVSFQSDTDATTLPGLSLPVIGEFTEGHKPVFISVALGNGNFLHAKICSDVNEHGCANASDSISISERSSVVPEPGTFILFGSGLLSSGAVKLSSMWRRRHLLKRMQS